MYKKKSFDNANMKCSHGYNIKTINCPYTQQFGLMCSMQHCDTISGQAWWCTYALKHVNNKYQCCSCHDCPASLKDNLCSMRHK